MKDRHKKADLSVVMRLPLLLVRARQAAGEKQQDVALRMGIAGTVLSAIENGRKEFVSEATIESFARAMNMDELGKKQLQLAGAHDQALRKLADVMTVEQLRATSVAIRLSVRLKSEECRGLEMALMKPLRGFALLDDLKAGILPAGEGEDPHYGVKMA